PTQVYVPSPLFVFPSRARHTRYPRDWSSDVCSSDLALPDSAAKDGLQDRLDAINDPITVPAVNDADGNGIVDDIAAAVADAEARSEERRVGSGRCSRVAVAQCLSILAIWCTRCSGAR